MIPVTTTVIAAMMAVSSKAWRTSACEKVSVTTPSPGFSAVQAMPTSGSSRSAPT